LLSLNSALIIGAMTLSAAVIIVNWNGREYLRVCLDSLQKQTHPNFRVIVVDNGSTDGSLEMLAAEYPQVQVKALEENTGFVFASNEGAKLAPDVDVLVMLNNDTEVEPDWLLNLTLALESHPEAGAAASKMLLFDRRHVLHSAGDIMAPGFFPQNRGVWEEDVGQYDDDVWVFGPCGGAAAYRQEVWQALGGFDSRLFMYLEDVDFAWRMQKQGWKTIFAPQARVYHHLSATGGGKFASYYVGRNLILLHRWHLTRDDWRSQGKEILRGHAKIIIDALRAWRSQPAQARLRGVMHGLLGVTGKR